MQKLKVQWFFSLLKSYVLWSLGNRDSLALTWWWTGTERIAMGEPVLLEFDQKNRVNFPQAKYTAWEVTEFHVAYWARVSLFWEKETVFLDSRELEG